MAGRQAWRERSARDPRVFVRAGRRSATNIDLDEEQRRATEHDGGPLLIVAGPGSGKTRVLTERVQHLVGSGRASPEEVLCLTFTEKAAGEMSRRLDAHKIDTASMDVGTFHSFALRVLEDNELDTGLDMRGGIIEKAEGAVWAINHVDDFGLQSVEVGNNASAVMRSIMDGISSFARELKTPDDIDKYVEERLPGKDEEEKEELQSLEDLSRVYRKYQEFKREMRVVDYDDLVAEAVKLFSTKPAICRRYRDKYKHVLVDELQDNNVAQFKLAKLLAEEGNITAVGDEDQAIYSFQGAYKGIFNDFKSTFRRTYEARLTTNYRSSENIVRVTNDWMAGISGPGTKALHSVLGEDGDKITVVECDDDLGEAKYVAEKIAELAGVPSDGGAGRNSNAKYRDIAILTRRRIDGEKFEEALAERGIPAKYLGSTDLLYAPAVRDLMAHVKAAAEPATSGAEITHLMRLHGITERNIARINRAAKSRMFGGGDGGDCVLATIRGERGHARPRTSQEGEMLEFKEKLDRLVEIGRGSLPVDRAVYKILMSVSGLYRRVVLDDTRQGRTQLWQLNEVYRIAQSYAKLYDKAALSEFVKHLYQMGEQEGESRESLAAENAVEITTIHQSKGREFKTVFVADVSARRLPVTYRRRRFDVPEGMSSGGGGGGGEERKKELHREEERRLLYVAMTRAKSKLFITHAKKYGGNTGESRPSAFLGEGEIDSANNPRIATESHMGGGAKEAVEEPGVAERLTRDLQAKAIAAVSSMSLKTAVQRVVELSKIKHYVDHNTLNGFDPRAVLAIDDDQGADDQGADLDAELEGSRPTLIDAESIKFSASKIEMYKKCPLQFKFCYALEVPRKPGGPADVGSVVHAVLEKVAKRRMNGEATSEEQAIELLERGWRYANFDSKKNADEYRAKADRMIRTFLEWDAKAAARGSSIVGAEREFELEMDGLRFIGKMDRVDKEADGRYVVIDYKTGKSRKPKVAEDVQMNLYALATKKIYGELPAKAMQLFVLDGKEASGAVDAEAVARERASVIDSARAILDGQFPAKPDYMACSWCDYRDICDEKHPRSQRQR